MYLKKATACLLLALLLWPAVAQARRLGLGRHHQHHDCPTCKPADTGGELPVLPAQPGKLAEQPAAAEAPPAAEPGDCPRCQRQAPQLLQKLGQKIAARAPRVVPARRWLLDRLFGATAPPADRLVVLVFTDRATCVHCRELEAALQQPAIRQRVQEVAATTLICDASDVPADAFTDFAVARVPVLVLGKITANGELTVLRQQQGKLSDAQLLEFLTPTSGPSTPVGG